MYCHVSLNLNKFFLFQNLSFTEFFMKLNLVLDYKKKIHFFNDKRIQLRCFQWDALPAVF